MSRGSAAVFPYTIVPRLPDEERVDLDRWLSGSGPLEIEIGPGRGLFMLERCAADPAVRLLGIEIRRKWATVVDRRLQQRGYGDRARTVCHDAKQALARLTPDGAIATVFLHFPDPWWKKRHQKRLVMGEAVLEEVCRLLSDDGALFIQTDVPERAEQYERQLRDRAELYPAGESATTGRLSSNPYRARSNRERRAEADGLPIHRLRYRRRARG